MLVQLFKIDVTINPAPAEAPQPQLMPTMLPRGRRIETAQEMQARIARVDALAPHHPPPVITSSRWTWAAPTGGYNKTESGTFYT